MNELSTFVDEAFRNYSESALLRLLNQLEENPGEQSDLFGLPANLQYVVKRLLGGLLARVPDLKFNAYLVLSVVGSSISNIKVDALYEYIASISNHKKHCDGKPSEIEAYVIGKILAFKALKSIFVGSLTVVNHLCQIFPQFPEYEEQLIELIGQLIRDKKQILQLSKLAPTTKSGFVLHHIIKADAKKTAPVLNSAMIGDVLGQLEGSYPKHSICLDYIAPLIKIYIENPVKFFEEHLDLIFAENSDVKIRQLFYILHLLKGHLEGCKLNSDNIWNLISVKILGGWILQLKVKNKHIRQIAQSITIQFDNDPALALSILKNLHQKELYLENINHKHPLYILYQIVPPHQYTTYLFELATKDSTLQQEEKPVKSFYNQFEVFLVTRHQDLTIEQISKIIGFFIIRYRQKEDETSLQAINTILNALLSPTSKKTQSLNNRASLILSKIQLDTIQLGQQQVELRKVIKNIRNIFKANKQQKNIFNISFYNFIISVAFYFLVYPEEVDIYGDLEMIEKDIKQNILFKEQGLQPKKKRKGSEQVDKNKPIHVLIDIFIGLLTKSSQFLRSSINLLFQQIIPYINGQDISHLLEVIIKPDTQFIQDNQ